jgi:hypothetical protein
MPNIIKSVFFGKFNSQHYAGSLDELSLDTDSLERQIVDSVNGNGNIEEPFDVYITTYSDNSTTLLFLYPNSEDGYGLGGTILYKMRQYSDPLNASYLYNDSDPNNELNYTATLTIGKERIDRFGYLITYKQRLKGKCVRLIGALLKEIDEKDIEGTDIHNAIYDMYTHSKFIELSDE